MATTLADLLKPMLRMAGITTLPGITPSADQYGELYPMVNRMLAHFSLNGHLIYTTSITQFPLTSGVKTYTIGPGGAFDTPRPIFIKGADVLFPTTPVLRRGLTILDDDQWRAVSIQDITGAPPYQLYYDGGNDANGRGTISIRFQPPTGYTLELYTWLALKTDFSASTDAAIFPPGYEELIVTNGALRVVSLYPLDSKLDGMQRQELRTMATLALQAVQTLNMNCPKLGTGDASTADGHGWLAGPFA